MQIRNGIQQRAVQIEENRADGKLVGVGMTHHRINAC